ncbi:8589_t:CDS:2 [Entrophospora sp. SA101]|nr:8589_t:CDS:2 [Entrophospora sp. SA101]
MSKKQEERQPNREFNHRVKSITASIFTPAELESLKNGGNAKAAEIWLAKFKWMDFPESDNDDIESIRNFMSMKYEEKKWLDESLLKAKNKKPSNSEYYESKGTFTINPPALNNKFNNSNGNLSDDSSSQNSSLNDYSPVSPTSRKSSSSISDLSDNNTNYLKYSSDSSFNDSNELDDFFDTLNNSSNQQPVTKRNNIYPEPNKSSPSYTNNTNTITNSFFTQKNLLENRRPSNLHSKRSINNSSSINDPFSNLLPPTKSETSRRFSPQKLDDNDIFSDFQTAPDNNNSQQTIYSTNLNSYSNTFPNGSSNVNQTTSINQFNNNFGNLYQAQQKYSFFPSSTITNTSISNTDMNLLQQKQFNYSKSMSFDNVFSDLDPLRNK